MKKTLLLSILVLLIGLSGTAFAVSTPTYVPDGINLGTAPYNIVIKLSKNVQMFLAISAAPSATEPAVNYVLGAYHSTGSRTFGTSNMDQKLYFQEVTGVAVPAVGTSTTVGPDWAAWTAL